MNNGIFCPKKRDLCTIEVVRRTYTEIGSGKSNGIISSFNYTQLNPSERKWVERKRGNVAASIEGRRYIYV